MNYIWCVIDKGLKQISFIDSDGKQCQAEIEKQLQEQYNMPSRMDTTNRFSVVLVHDYVIPYKKYAKWKVIE